MDLNLRLTEFLKQSCFNNKDYNEQEEAVDYNNAAMTPTDMVNNNLEPANQDQPLPGSIAAESNQRSSLSSSASESANQRSSMCSSTSDKTNQRSSMCSNTSSRPPSLELGIFRCLELSYEHGCSHCAIVTAILLQQICYTGYQCKCLHGVIVTMILNPMQPISCDK